MPDFKSDLITTKESANISDKIITPPYRDGADIRYKRAVITLAGTEVAGDTFQLVDLPVGATVIPQLCTVTCSADPGTTLTLKVGGGGNSDRYAENISLNAGGQVPFTNASAMPAAVANPFTTTETSRVLATVLTANTLTANVKLVFLIAYAITV